MDASVYIKRNADNIQESLLEGLDWVGINNMIGSGSRVAIKPNLTYPFYKEGVTTSPNLLEILVKVLKDKTPNISIVESNGSRNAWQAETAFKGHGIDELSRKYGIKAINLSKTDYDWVDIERKGRKYEIPLSKFLTDEIDVFITVPVPKIHSMTGVSLGLKNQWGCVPDPERLNYHYLFDYAICDINKILNPRIIIGDAKYMLDVSGPMYGKVRKMDMLIVSNDIGSFELACCSIMGIDPESIEHLKIAKHKGMLLKKKSDIIFNIPIDSIRTDKFILKRTLRKYIVLAAFKSKLITWLFYGPSIGKFLHIILYFFKKPDHLKESSEQ